MVRTVHELIPEHCVLITRETMSKSILMKRLVALLADAGKVTDSELFLSELLERESLVATGMGNQCAIPHAHSAAVTEAAIAVAILGENSGVDFGSPDGLPARLVFLMAGPMGEAEQHLKILAKVARLLHDPAYIPVLLGAEDEAAFRRLIAERTG
jgi:fructose-specific phosphotransferase system IIA component